MLMMTSLQNLRLFKSFLLTQLSRYSDNSPFDTCIVIFCLLRAVTLRLNIHYMIEYLPAVYIYHKLISRDNDLWLFHL